LSIHEDLIHELEVSKASDRNFGLVFAIFFAIIGIYSWFGEAGEFLVWAIILSAVFLIISIIKPGLLSPLNSIWTKFGLLLHKIVNPIILGIIFFLVVTPFGLVLRAIGKDLLSLKLDRKSKSYWIYRTPPGPSPDSMKNQY
jgi:hypothetical protein